MMTIRRTAAAGITALVAGLTIGAVASSRPGRQQEGPPALRDPSVPRTDQDLGSGERLLLVVGGAFATREEAEAANGQIVIGDVQGFYVARTDQFEGLDREIGDPGNEYVLLSAFRTSRGARDFLELVQTAGYSAFITPRLRNLGSEYVGLGQEEDPSGDGPLTEPIPGLTR
jgi:hypothetical protein